MEKDLSKGSNRRPENYNRLSQEWDRIFGDLKKDKKMNIEIFGKTQCPFCDKAKFEAEPYGYTYKQLDTDFDMQFIAENFPTARTFPQIRIDGENIGGYDNFVEYLRGLR